MAKKSKRRAGRPASAAATGATHQQPPTTGDEALRQVLAHPDNLIPRQRHLYPDDWAVNVACIHPFIRPEYEYVCIDAELYIGKQDDGVVSTRNRAKVIDHYGDCPICFQAATLTCSRCGTVSYCRKEHQAIHWKKSHKKACRPNPSPHKFKLKLSTFRGLTEACFEGHEFLVVKPTEKLSTLQEICDQVLEPADDLLEMPGFGANQLNADWLFNNPGHPTYRNMLQRFGWTSGRIGMEIVSGYRAAEARIMYLCFCDDSFQMQTDLSLSYYGRALFPPLNEGKHVRGNLVIYKLFLKNKRLCPPPPETQQLHFLNMQMTDDADLKFEFILFPINKAEIALMLSERCKALDKGSYTTRMWRYPIRQSERQIEMEDVNNNGAGGSVPLTMAF